MFRWGATVDDTLSPGTVMIRATFSLCALLLAACGDLTTPGGTVPPTLFEVRGQVTGQLADDVTGELRAALSWDVYDSELVDCVAAVDVVGPLDWVGNEDDAVLARDLDRCLTFSSRGRRETASVPLQPSLPASFDIPVDGLPDPSLLSGDEGARLGLAGVLIYTDDNDNGRYDETARGAAAFVDRVRGTSQPRGDDVERMTWLVYREGELSPLWKIFRGLYGCSEPAPGFSTVTVALDQTLGTISCVVDDRAIDVVLGDFAAVGCAADPAAGNVTRPGDTGPAADSTMICDSGDVYVTTNPDSVCPSFISYTLYGCDVSSEAACRASFWDLQDNQPGWWPCGEGSGTTFNIVDAVFATDGVDERLFSVAFRNGTPIIAIDDLVVTVVVGDTPITLSGDALTLIDNDNNGAFNAGDVVHVGEVANEFTRATVRAGVYLVRIEGLVDAEVYGAWQPFALPTIDVIDVSAVDAPAVVSDGIDDVAILTFVGPAGAVGQPFSGLSARAYVGGEIPIQLTAHVERDVDGDGLFEPGDTLMLKDLDGDGFDTLSIAMLRSLGGLLYIQVQTAVGVDAVATLAYVDVQVQ